MNYWNEKGKYQELYDKMVKENFVFTKKTLNSIRRYYRYFNDGDIPYRFKDINMFSTKGEIEKILEDDIDLAIINEYGRYKKTL